MKLSSIFKNKYGIVFACYLLRIYSISSFNFSLDENHSLIQKLISPNFYHISLSQIKNNGFDFQILKFQSDFISPSHVTISPLLYYKLVMLLDAVNMEFSPRYHHTADMLLDEQMIIEAAKQNPEHFGPLYDKYYKQIFGYVYQRMDDKDTAFDLTAQVFLKALTNIEKYEYKGVPFASWLYRIAHSEVMQLFRNNSKLRTVNADISDLRNICEEVEEEYMEQYKGILMNVIKELPEDELQLIELRFFEKRAFKEIAEILNLTETNAKVKLYRILERVKKTLTKKSK